MQNPSNYIGKLTYNEINYFKVFKVFFFFYFRKKKFVKKVNDQKIFFKIENSLTFDRALYYYENDTLEWIDSFKDKEVFWDIGSCTGVYSIYASLKKNVKFLHLSLLF